MNRIAFLITLSFFTLESGTYAQEDWSEVRKIFDTKGEKDIVLVDIFGGKTSYDYYLSEGIVFCVTSYNTTASIALTEIDFSKSKIVLDYLTYGDVAKQNPYALELVSITGKTEKTVILFFASKETAELARNYLKDKSSTQNQKVTAIYNNPFDPKIKKVEEKVPTQTITNGQSTDSKSDFCTALTKLINDAPNGFVNVYDASKFEVVTQNYVKTKIHQSKIQLPGVLKTEVHDQFGLSYWIEIGEYNNKSEVNTQGEAFVKKITECYPDFYVFSKSEKNNSTTIQIGRKIKGGYTGAIMVIYALNNETTKKINLSMRIETGVPSTFYNIEGKPVASEFSTSINKIYNEIPNKFENIKTVEHQSDDVEPIYFYEISPKLLGASKTYVYAGTKGLNTKPVQCVASFYNGSSLEEAKNTYSKVSATISQAFGSEFVYTMDRPSELYKPVLPEKPEKLVIYVRKTHRSYESLGICALVLNKETDGKYRVYLNFYNTGM